MRKILFLIPLLLFFACNNQPGQKDEGSQKMSFGAAFVAPVIDSTKITPNGDTIVYSHTVETVSVTYDKPIVVVKLKGSVTPPTNLPPTAIAGPDVTITLPISTVKLDASASSDPEGQPLKYFWRQTAGPTKATLVDTNKVVCTASNLKAGAYTFEVRAVDPLNAFTADFVTITVKDIVIPPGGNPVPFSFTAIPISDADIVAPGRGAEQWHDRVDVNVPTEGTRTIPKDRYQRFVATRIANSTKGSYNWTFFDNLVSQCIANNQKFSFGYMTVYGDGTTNEGLVKFSDGTLAAYPEWVHNAMMQNGGPKPWKYSNYYIPNYNNTAYLDWLLEFNKAIDSHIKSTTISGVPMKNVVNIIDIRGMGNWGEWHHYPYVGDYPNKLPAGQQPTFASLKRIVDAFLQGFPDNPLVAMISAHDRERLVNTWNPPAISDYLATAKNNWGGVGYRNDHWGGLDTYTWDYLDHPALANVWKTGYITGEPPGSTNGTNNMGDLVRQMQKYHGTSFGNGNMGGGESNSTVRNNVRAASKATGYRIISTGGSYTPGANSISITNNWQNVGIAPTYENWDITYELVSSSGTTILGVSTFKLRLFLPSNNVSAHTDTFQWSAPSGTYTIRMVVKDPTGYRAPLTLALTGRYSDGSYNFKTSNQ